MSQSLTTISVTLFISGFWMNSWVTCHQSRRLLADHRLFHHLVFREIQLWLSHQWVQQCIHQSRHQEISSRELLLVLQSCINQSIKSQLINQAARLPNLPISVTISIELGQFHKVFLTWEKIWKHNLRAYFSEIEINFLSNSSTLP